MNPHHIIANIITVFFFVAMWPFASEATTIFRLNLDSLLEQSSLVVEGTVRNLTNNEGDNAHIPTTSYEVCGLTVHLGEYLDQCITLTIPGGYRAGIRGSFSGMPTLEVEKSYLMFLTRNTKWRSPFVGWWQGVYQIYPTDDEPVVLSVSGHPVVKLDPSGFIETQNNAQHTSTPQGEAETANREPSSRPFPEHSAAFAVSREEFLMWIEAVAADRLERGVRVPAGLPEQWKCLDNASTPPTDPPPTIPWQDTQQ